MTGFTVVSGGRHGQAGYYSLGDLPQRPDISKTAIDSGWPEFDEIFRLYPGQFTVVTGRAGSGKSTFLLNLIAQYRRLHGMRFFLHCPENENYVRRKLRTIWQDDDEGWRIFARDGCFVQSAYPEYYDAEPKTLQWVLDNAVIAVSRDHVDLIIIDPWNELERAKPREQSMTEYVAECLMYLKQFCRSMNAAVIIVAHPTKEGLRDGKVPSLVDIEASLAWYNKCDNGLIVHREAEKLATRVISAKVRESPEAGRLGECWFSVNQNTGIFTPDYGAWRIA